MSAQRPASHASVPRRIRSGAKRLRREITDAERRLWYAIRAHRFQGLLFRRQVPIAGYVVDFACHQRGLIVEIDGATHSTDAERARDAIRTRRLEAEGYRVVRFWNDKVTRNLPGVLHRLHQILKSETASSGRS